LLDDTLVDQIAAGEVIERPANLVKELLENAIDAEASAITVSVEDGGRALVRISDDGIGMSREDARLAIERHATSKIRSFEDLTHVGTLGFRGEALPSIASVSRMTITTRPDAELEGTRILVEGGELREVAPAGCPPGTCVEVSDLFFNVPARKKFLRARQTETSRIFEVCQRVALSHPELRLIVRSDGRTAREYLPARRLSERAYQVFGDMPLEEIHAEREGIVLDAVLAPPHLARAGARQLFLLVNDRPISDRGLARAIAFAYGSRLPPGHYPRGVVSLRIPPEDVDVNAHPQKTEVRFVRSAQLLDRVTRMLAPYLPDAPAADAYWDARIGGVGPTTSTERASAPTEHGGSAVAQPSTPYESPPPGGLRFVTQVRESLLVCESADALLVLDRERADAIRRYEALASALEAGTAQRHHLLFPDRVELTATRRAGLQRHADSLNSLGFECSALGDETFAVRAVPAIAADAPAAFVLMATLDALEASGADASESREQALRAVSNASATANGEALEADAARAIVAAISLEQPEHQDCVLGRIPWRSAGRGGGGG
jgi:DNA mismatch repair protein MutL